MKKLVAVLLAGLMVLSLAACGGGDSKETEAKKETAAKTEAPADAAETKAEGTAAAPEKKDSYSVGITIQDLSNATWATQVNTITEKCEELGWTVTAVQHDNDAQKCITQIENFTNSGCDFIFIQSSAAEAIEDAVKAAQDKGICVIGTGVALDFADMNYTNDNYDAGYRCGQAIGNWANETFGEDHKLMVAQFLYDEIAEVTQRTDGQLDGLKETHPNFEVVANAHPTDSATAMTETENVLTAHPEIEVIFNWGDSMALGSLEAVRSMKREDENMAIVSVDGTDEAVTEIAAGSSLIMSCSLGGPEEQGIQQFDMLQAYIAGTNEDHYYSPNITIDRSNAKDYVK
ncbi:MAG: substrate-binding domain-containing protein [Lachnospiraceae bacterium]|nr:substrate-binding domain-containing protein [Lachnospiraceae bacterium]